MKINWKLWAVLAVANLIASMILLPYALALQGDAASLTGGMMPEWAFNLIMLIAQVAQAVLLNAPLILLGLFLADRVGFGVPILSAWLRRESAREPARRMIKPVVIIGLAGGVLLVLLSYAMSALTEAEALRLGYTIPDVALPAPWKGFLASISAGITEESLLRLFLMTFFVWLGAQIWRTPDGQPKAALVWGANILAALLFGALHFMNVAMIGLPFTPMIILQILLLNGSIGVAFGWLYWKYGLESAMLAHFLVDVVLHVLVPLFAPALGV